MLRSLKQWLWPPTAETIPQEQTATDIICEVLELRQQAIIHGRHSHGISVVYPKHMEGILGQQYFPWISPKGTTIRERILQIPGIMEVVCNEHLYSKSLVLMVHRR